jgi:endonuclease YncB( thermonuclease family)
MRLIRQTILVSVAAMCVATYLTQQQADSAPGKSVQILRGGDAWNGSSSRVRRTFEPKASEQHPASAGAVLIDNVTRVRDGDTIVVGLIPIRIANLDCAEKGTTAGEAATARVRTLVTGAQLTCTLEGRRSYDREVGLCALPDGRDLGEVLIGEGACGRWR